MGNNLWLTVALWGIWVVYGVTLELLGLYAIDGLWPLTWVVRDAMKHSELAVLAVCLLTIGGGSWLAYHFLFEPRIYGR